MDLQRVGVLAPCENLGDYPTYMQGDDAAELLAAWTTAWRPGLIATTGRIPEVVSAYDPPSADDWRAGLVLAAAAEGSSHAAEWLDAVRSAQGAAEPLVVDRVTDRIAEEGIAPRAAIIAAVDRLLPDLPPVDVELEAEFFALGYAYLQVMRFVPEMQYGTVFSPVVFESAAVEAARAAVAGDTQATLAALQRCYDQLEQTRHHTYPVEIHLVEVLLTADTVLGDRFADELNRSGRDADTPVNVLLPGRLAEAMAASAPASLAALRRAVGDGAACLVTGAYDGADVSLLPPEAMHDQLSRSLASLEKHFGRRPAVFAQHASAAPPRLPQLLADLGLRGALLTGFDGADPLPCERGRTTWMGVDGTPLEASVVAPRDASRVETALRLCEHLSDTLERDNTATVLLAGWPGGRSPALADLVRVTRRSGVLGKFRRLDEFFTGEPLAGHWASIDNNALGPRPNDTPRAGGAAALADERDRLLRGLGRVAAALNDRTPAANPDPAGGAVLAALGGEGSPAQVAINPWSASLPAPGVGGGVPALGYGVTRSTTTSPGPPRAEGETLRNERLEAIVNRETGGLRAVRPHGTRRNALSQRVRLVRGRGTVAIAEPRAGEVSVAVCDDTAGEIHSRGELVDRRGASLARFEQTFRLEANADWLELHLRVEPVDDAVGARLLSEFALSDAPTAWRRGVQWARLPVERAAFVAGEYVQAGDGGASVTVACAAATLFQRRGERAIAAMVPRSDDGVFEQRFAVSLGQRYPLRSALGAFAGPVVGAAAAPSSSAGWWVHCDAANVQVSRIEFDPTAADPTATGDDAALPLRFRLIETEGRAVKATVRLCRPLRSAVRESLGGEAREELPVVDGAVEVEVGAYGWLQVAAAW